MARRKRELLDLLRERARQNESARSSEAGRAEKPAAPKRAPKKPAQAKPRGATPPPKPAPKPAATAPSKPAAKPAGSWAKPKSDSSVKKKRRPSGGASGASFVERFARYRGPAMATAGLLLIVALIKFWPAGTPAEATGKGSGAAEAREDQPFAILVATYQFSPTGRQIAQDTGRALRDEFPNLADPLLTAYPAENPDTIELWIGEADQSEDLEELLSRVQATSVPTDRNNSRPFATAVIKRRRSISP